MQITLHDPTKQHKRPLPRHQSQFYKDLHPDQQISKETDTQQTNYQPVSVLAQPKPIQITNPDNNKKNIAQNQPRSASAQSQRLETLQLLTEHCRSTSVGLRQQGFGILGRIYRNLLQLCWYDIVEEKNVEITISDCMQLISYIANPPTHLIDDAVTAVSPLDAAMLVIHECDNYSAAINFLTTLLVGDEGFVSEQMSHFATPFFAMSEQMVSLTQLGLIQILVSLLNKELDQNDRSNVFLILERYYLGSAFGEYTAPHQDEVNQTFLTKLFQDELAVSLKDLVETGFVPSTAGRVSIRCLLARHQIVRCDQAIEVLLSNYKIKKDAEVMHLALMLVRLNRPADCPPSFKQFVSEYEILTVSREAEQLCEAMCILEMEPKHLRIDMIPPLEDKPYLAHICQKQVEYNQALFQMVPAELQQRLHRAGIRVLLLNDAGVYCLKHCLITKTVLNKFGFYNYLGGMSKKAETLYKIIGKTDEIKNLLLLELDTVEQQVFLLQNPEKYSRQLINYLLNAEQTQQTTALYLHLLSLELHPNLQVLNNIYMKKQLDKTAEVFVGKYQEFGSYVKLKAAQIQLEKPVMTVESLVWLGVLAGEK